VYFIFIPKSGSRNFRQVKGRRRVTWPLRRASLGLQLHTGQPKHPIFRMTIGMGYALSRIPFADIPGGEQ